jgi:hypothetical protein
MDTLISDLLFLHSKQTEDEQKVKHTKGTNKQGFNKIDAPILTSIAEWYIKTGFISFKQQALVEKKLTKYRKQLATKTDEWDYMGYALSKRPPPEPMVWLGTD